MALQERLSMGPVSWVLRETECPIWSFVLPRQHDHESQGSEKLHEPDSVPLTSTAEYGNLMHELPRRGSWQVALAEAMEVGHSGERETSYAMTGHHELPNWVEIRGADMIATKPRRKKVQSDLGDSSPLKRAPANLLQSELRHSMHTLLNACDLQPCSGVAQPPLSQLAQVALPYALCLLHRSVDGSSLDRQMHGPRTETVVWSHRLELKRPARLDSILIAFVVEMLEPLLAESKDAPAKNIEPS